MPTEDQPLPEHPLADQTFSDVVRGMQHAVNTAQDTIKSYQMQQYSLLFDAEGRPSSLPVVLPNGNRVDIPYISIMPQEYLSIDEFQIEFAVNVDSTVIKTIDSQDLTRAAMNVSFSKNPDVKSGLNVKIVFKKHQASEGLSRVKDAFDNTL